MTGRTHDLAAFTALLATMTISPLPKVTMATALVAFGANMIGGLAADLDQPTSQLYKRIRGGTFLSRIIHPLLGGHRFISHSIIGILLFGFIVDFLLEKMRSFLIVDMEIVWWAFMIGFVSHLLMDMLTREGVPWLFPIPIRFGLPPLRALRIKTGGIVEKSFIFPALLMINAVLIYLHYEKFLNFLHSLK